MSVPGATPPPADQPPYPMPGQPAPQYAPPSTQQYPPPYGAPQYTQPQYAASQYAQPQYGAPQYAAQYAAPQYAAPQYAAPYAQYASRRNLLAATLLCFFLGVLGVHRFYVGKVGTGILQLLTAGGFGIWWLVDFILLVCQAFKDQEGYPLRWDTVH